MLFFFLVCFFFTVCFFKTEASCNYAEFQGYPYAVVDCSSTVWGSFTASCTGEIKFYDPNKYCEGQANNTNFSNNTHCGGSTCYAVYKSGNVSCSGIYTFLVYDVCITATVDTSIMVTCDGLFNYSTTDCSGSATLLNTLNKCYFYQNKYHNTSYYYGYFDGTGYCSSSSSLFYYHDHYYFNPFFILSFFNIILFVVRIVHY